MDNAMTGIAPDPQHSVAAVTAFDPQDYAAGDLAFLDGSGSLFGRISATLAHAERLPQAGSMRSAQPRSEQQSADAAPSAADDVSAVAVPGFAAGQVIQTDKGAFAVEDMQVGQRVLTRDHGFQRVVWTGRRDLTAADLRAQPELCPVMIAAGALGPNMPEHCMIVSPQHRLLAEGPRTRLLFGEREVLIPAQHLVGFPGITRGGFADTSYIHVMCAAHEVIWSDGIWMESFQLGDQSLAGLDVAQRVELSSIFRRSGDYSATFPAARRTLKRHESDLLLV